MSIADEIRAVLQEVGTAITVIKPGQAPVTEGNYMDDNSHVAHTNPAIRAFFLDVSLHSPTDVSIGDTITWLNGAKKLLITAMLPEMFENEVVEYSASGYLVNSEGAFHNLVTEKPQASNNYQEKKNWVDLYPGETIYGSLMDRLYRSSVMAVANESMDVQLNNLQLFVSSYYQDVAMGMRYTDASGVYKVEQTEDSTFPGIRIIYLTNETRE